MHKRIATGLIVLIFILGVAIVFYHQYTDIQQLKQEAAKTEKLLEEQHKGVAENDLPPAEPGKKWVPHGDHFHEVPIDAPDVWQEGTQGASVQIPHLKAVDLQQRGGHWSDAYLPDIETHYADDPQALQIARAAQIIRKYKNMQSPEQYGQEPEFLEAIQVKDNFYRQVSQGVFTPARHLELLRLLWPVLDEQPATLW
ncbi:hypothetical protein C6496_13970 [Candidatus Poribacteria bacterium]|nr:MAG: hypothetical protein C6496_13970 [Candidatus Poribacteria bacterium]